MLQRIGYYREILLLNVWKIRKNHQRLCNLVNHADSILSIQIAASFLGSLTLICLTLYEIILGNDVGIWYRCTDMFLLTIAGLKMLIDCISGARVKQAVSTQHTRTHARTRACTLPPPHTHTHARARSCTHAHTTLANTFARAIMILNSQYGIACIIDTKITSDWFWCIYGGLWRPYILQPNK